MTNARPPKGTGAVGVLPCGHTQATGPQRQVPAALTPEYALTGCILLVDLPTACAVLDRVRDSDVGDYRLQLVLSVARGLAAEGIRPDSTLVLDRAVKSGTVTGAAKIGDLADLIHNLARSVPVPVSVHWYAEAVIENAVLRRLREAVTRISQAITNGAVDAALELAAREIADVYVVAARRATPAPSLKVVK